MAERVPARLTAREGRKFAFTVVEFPDDSIAPVPALPPQWRSYPHLQATQAIGDVFLDAQAHVALPLPSALIPEERIYALNPMHPRHKEIRVVAIEPVILDERFFQRTP